ncbi:MULTISPECIES: hypothetical protein [Hydrocarboniphaga]|uniref:Uncharacterized protein n=1 Tax=Hydrocarboniphaga effusa AP103 TaxID=1172194 RepID=I8T1Z2_9GAMM|nr:MULTISPECIES: hypothetical protein [Hydrocarboniphaga]EIT67683.1 hypothetical protein WQQ_41180 [Hydrocarboniphaga effusa AP103]MDZ4080934.1 hypothetical protein [Hydrocarboniphaga sp.]
MTPDPHAHRLPEHHESLWRLIVAPALWALHFLACYLTASIWCAKAGLAATLAPARWAIVVYTLLALIGIALTARSGLRRHRRVPGALPFDEPTALDRHRSLGFATVLLSGLSALATIFVALPALFFPQCG